MKSENEPKIFECKKCGDCCKGYGGTFVTPGDIKRISEHIQADPKTFVAEYCEFSGNKPLLAQGRDGYCVFWDKVCVIHPVKPRMCRSWPFIENILADITNWRVMAGSCPGIRADIPDGIIRKRVCQEIDRENRQCYFQTTDREG